MHGENRMFHLNNSFYKILYSSYKTSAATFEVIGLIVRLSPQGFLRWANPGLFFINFHVFIEKILVVRRIQNRIVRVEGEKTAH